MPLVDGDGRSKLACARSQPMGYRTPLAQVGGGATSGRGPILRGWAGPCRRRSWAGCGPGRLADEAREAVATLREVDNALRQWHSLRPPPDNEPLINGLIALAYGHASLDIPGNAVCKDSA